MSTTDMRCSLSAGKYKVLAYYLKERGCINMDVILQHN